MISRYREAWETAQVQTLMGDPLATESVARETVFAEEVNDFRYTAPISALRRMNERGAADLSELGGEDIGRLIRLLNDFLPPTEQEATMHNQSCREVQCYLCWDIGLAWNYSNLLPWQQQMCPNFMPLDNSVLEASESAVSEFPGHEQIPHILDASLVIPDSGDGLTNSSVTLSRQQLNLPEARGRRRRGSDTTITSQPMKRRGRKAKPRPKEREASQNKELT